MKRLFPVLLCLVAFFTLEKGVAHAESVTCTGKNLLTELENEQPQIAEKVRARSQSILNGRGLIWKIEKQGLRPSYLFGTIHLSDPRLLTLNPAAEEAFQSSSTVALEIIEMLDPQLMASKAFSIMQSTMYSDGTTLDSKFAPADLEAIKKKAASALGLPWNVAGRMKPWALMGTLVLPACELQRKRQNKPFLDIKLGNNANRMEKKLVGLETLESQMAAISSIPETYAIKSLVQAVRMGPRMDDLFETMIQLYLKEDMGTVWALMLQMGENGFVENQNAADAGDYAEFQRVIIDKRNFGMADSAIPLIEKGSAFIAVGALHLPGEKGIVNILAQKGYTLTRMTR